MWWCWIKCKFSIKIDIVMLRARLNMLEYQSIIIHSFIYCYKTKIIFWVACSIISDFIIFISSWYLVNSNGAASIVNTLKFFSSFDIYASKHSQFSPFHFGFNGFCASVLLVATFCTFLFRFYVFVHFSSICWCC